MNFDGHDAETSILSILINNPEEYYNVSIKPYMLSSNVLSLLLDLIGELNRDGVIPTYDIIIMNIETKGRGLDGLHPDLITYLKSLNVDKRNLKVYEERVLRNYKTYQLLDTANEITRSVNNNVDIDKIISSIRNKIDLISSTNNSSDTQAIGDSIIKLWDVVADRYENPHLPGITTGFENIDMPTGGLMGGDVMIVAARPSMGKTSWVCNSAIAMGKAGIPCAIFSLEMPRDVLLERILAIESKVSVNNIRFGRMNKDEIDRVKDSIKRLKGLPIFIDSTFLMDINYISGVVRRLKNNHGIKAVFLDYIQLLAERDSDSTNILGRISRAIKLLSNELGICFIVTSQLNRLVEYREDKRPVLSDLRQSGNLEEDADIVAFLYRDAYYNPKSNDSNQVEFIIRKNRNGPVGMVKLGIDIETNYMYDWK